MARKARKKKKKRDLSEATCRLIEQGKRILLRRDICGVRAGYLSSWTNVFAGIDHAVWTRDPKTAVEICNLETAFVLAKLYRCKVVVRGPKAKSEAK